MAITKVEYYAGGVKIGETTAEPFDEFSWVGAPVGVTTITAKLYEDGVLVNSTETLNVNITDVGFEPEYQAVLDYATAQGIPLPDATQQEIDNQLLVDYKATGAWDRDDVVVKFTGTADPTFKLIDWKRLVQMTPIGGLTWSVNGVKGNGTTGYIKTGFIPSTHGMNYTLNDAGFMYVNKTGDFNITSTFKLMGSYQTTPFTSGLVIGGRTDIAYRYINGVYSTGGYTPKTGVNALYRTSSTRIKTHYNSVDTITNNSVGVPTIEIYLMARNTSGSPTLHMNSTIQFLTIGGSKDSIHTDMETVLNTL